MRHAFDIHYTLFLSKIYAKIHTISCLICIKHIGIHFLNLCFGILHDEKETRWASITPKVLGCGLVHIISLKAGLDLIPFQNIMLSLMCDCRLCYGVWWHRHREWSTLLHPRREMQGKEQWPCVAPSIWACNLQNARRHLAKPWTLWQWKDILSVQCSRLMVETAQCPSPWLQLLHITQQHLVNWLSSDITISILHWLPLCLALNSDTG